MNYYVKNNYSHYKSNKEVSCQTYFGPNIAIKRLEIVEEKRKMLLDL